MSVVNRASLEYFTVTLLVAVCLGLLFSSLLTSRREVRDGIRRTEIIQFKSVLERYFNDHGFYPLEFNATPHRYVVLADDGEQALAWYLRAQLENKGVEDRGFDLEHNIFWRVVYEHGSLFYDVCGGEATCGVDHQDES